MILFKPYHAPLILAGKKTETRRTWPHGPRAREGSTHQAKTELFDESFAELRILRVYRQRLGDMTEKDAKAEGGYTLAQYKEAFKEINGSWDDNQVVYVVKFKLVGGICQRCSSYSYQFWLESYEDEDTGEEKQKAVCWDCTFDLMNGRGDMDDDPGEIATDRWEEEYEADPLWTPINTPVPIWRR